MPKRDRYEEDERDSPTPANGSNTKMIALLAGGGLALVLVLGFGAGGLFLYGKRKAAQREEAAANAVATNVVQEDAKAQEKDRANPVGNPGGPEKKAEPAMARADFERAVRGRNKSQIIEAIGRPDATREQVPDKAKVKTVGGRDTGERITFYYDWWSFHNRVINAATGKAYEFVHIRFGPNETADLIEYP